MPSTDAPQPSAPAQAAVLGGPRPVLLRTARPTFPVVLCPSCSGIEAGGFVGNRTGEVAQFNSSHFMDRSGFLFCQACGEVWSTVHLLPEGQAENQRGLFAIDALGVGPTFNPREADDVRYYLRLARTHIRFAGLQNIHGQASPRARRRAEDRVYDAEALCTLLDLPTDIKTAVLHHVKFLVERADLRLLGNVRRADGKTRPVRAEAITVAVVALVMERFHYRSETAFADAERMLSAFWFNHGPPIITPEEYRAAYHACSEWFGANLWRD